MRAVYYNKALNEEYILSGVKNLEQAWGMAEFVCKRNDWNINMFSKDVSVKVVSK